MKTRKILTILVLASAVILCWGEVSKAAGWWEQTKLLASDGATSDNFGRTVSVSGDYAIVAAYLDDDKGSGSGSAYIFKRDGTSWSQQAKLLASDGDANDEFGVSVSVSGDYAIVGADYDDDNGSDSGSAYIFGTCSSADLTGDLNDDCKVNYEDLKYMADNWLAQP